MESSLQDKKTIAYNAQANASLEVETTSCFFVCKCTMKYINIHVYNELHKYKVEHALIRLNFGGNLDLYLKLGHQQQHRSDSNNVVYSKRLKL